MLCVLDAMQQCSVACFGMLWSARLNKGPVSLQQVPQSAIGSIIGSGGSNINRIRQETGAKIKVFDEPVRDAPSARPCAGSVLNDSHTDIGKRLSLSAAQYRADFAGTSYVCTQQLRLGRQHSLFMHIC